jgi:hypothetical protein
MDAIASPTAPRFARLKSAVGTKTQADLKRTSACVFVPTADSERRPRAGAAVGLSDRSQAVTNS